MDKPLMEERKQIILDVIHSDLYIPMKLKELAIILNVPKDERDELKDRDIKANQLVKTFKSAINEFENPTE